LPCLTLPPPESTVNGPFFPLDVVRQGSLSILPCAGRPAAQAVTASLAAGAAGLGRRGRNLLGADGPVDVDDDGDDLEDVVDRGDGPANGGEGVEVEMVRIDGSEGVYNAVW
jgi:hypothetical protein